MEKDKLVKPNNTKKTSTNNAVKKKNTTVKKKVSSNNKSKVVNKKTTVASVPKKTSTTKVTAKKVTTKTTNVATKKKTTAKKVSTPNTQVKSAKKAPSKKVVNIDIEPKKEEKVLSVVTENKEVAKETPVVKKKSFKDKIKDKIGKTKKKSKPKKLTNKERLAKAREKVSKVTKEKDSNALKYKNEFFKYKLKIKILVYSMCLILVVLLLVVPFTYAVVDGVVNEEVYKKPSTVDQLTPLPKITLATNINLNTIINEYNYEVLDTKVNELLELKYPKFIVESLNKEGVVKSYTTTEDYLVVNFDNYEYFDRLGTLSVNVYYNEIKDILTVSTKIVEGYINEDGFTYDPTKKTIALSYDDGPHPVYTEQILALLNDYKAKATFFVQGLEVEDYPSIVKAVYDSGNEIGNHSYTHPNFERISLNEVLYEVNHTNELIFNITGEIPTLVRPPYGQLDDRIIEDIDVSYILWNNDPQDWKNRNTDYIASHVISNAEENGIIILHDRYLTTKDATEKILKELYLQGFQVVGVSDLAEYKSFNIETNKVYRSFN